MACTVHHFGDVTIVECTRGGKSRPGCPWPLTGRLAGRVCGRDLESPRGSYCPTHARLDAEGRITP